MKKVTKKDLKVLSKIKQKALKGGKKTGLGCPPPEPPGDD